MGPRGAEGGARSTQPAPKEARVFCAGCGRGGAKDTLAEWLRRRPAKPMGSPRVGSNPTGVDAHTECCPGSGAVAKHLACPPLGGGAGSNPTGAPQLTRKAAQETAQWLRTWPRHPLAPRPCRFDAQGAHTFPRPQRGSRTKTPLGQRCQQDTLAERLRRRPAKPMGSPRVGSNPTGVFESHRCRHCRRGA